MLCQRPEGMSVKPHGMGGAVSLINMVQERLIFARPAAKRENDFFSLVFEGVGLIYYLEQFLITET